MLVALKAVLTLFLDTFWIPDEILVIFASEPLKDFLSTEFFFSGTFLSTSLLTDYAFWEI